jgi:hypothetical protein
LGVYLADLPDLAAMKIDAISNRGIKRDFIDLYVLCKSQYTLSQVFSFYQRKYQKFSANQTHIYKSLVYFQDAEDDEMPRMQVPMVWDEVKLFFESEVKKYLSHLKHDGLTTEP